MKKLKAMFLIILMLFPSLVIFYPNNANAKTIADLRRELDEIEKRENENNNNISLTESEIATVQNEIGSIYNEINTITKDIKTATKEIEDLGKKIIEKDKAKLKYKQKLELVKQHYGVDFNITYFENNNIDKVKFYNLELKSSAKNISLIYDNKIGKFNYIFYDYDNEQSLKNYDAKKLMNSLNREKKLKLVIAEIKRLNEEYKAELNKIEEKYKEDDIKEIKELDYKKKRENS